jgi:hypothetical protein
MSSDHHALVVTILYFLSLKHNASLSVKPDETLLIDEQENHIICHQFLFLPLQKDVLRHENIPCPFFVKTTYHVISHVCVSIASMNDPSYN